MHKSLQIRFASLVACTLIGALSWAGPNEDEVRRIAAEISDVCSTQGMLACEKNFRNMEVPFEFFREYDKLEKTEAAFAYFVKSRYPGENFDWSLMDASLKLKLEVTMTPDTFLQGELVVREIPDGYQVKSEKGEFELRHDSNGWLSRSGGDRP